ncbi:UDP-N-acetylmuramoyl-L-alanine--D-glutamate ligase [Candidatus Saccharibacteria bacterium]|nr:UDP-N-acetylmuramoyl-L-alanine--D-glutamate ligase [Candidatus Saccharibacteria bacterium]
MRIAILGYGVEGKAAEQYFTEKGHDCQVFDNFTAKDIPNFQLENFDLVLRSPSVHPAEGWSSLTQYFFQNCPCQIIGVTGTKGKGTTSTIITALLRALGHNVYLVGNIGVSAITALDAIQPDDVVVYELSSFQLWDLKQSPHIAVVLRVEPDHLNIHDDFADYVAAKANITAHQTSDDCCVFYNNNPVSAEIAAHSAGTKIPYPVQSERAELDALLATLNLPGAHNQENAEAALLTCATFSSQSMTEFIATHRPTIEQTFRKFQGLPHRLQFIRELNNVKYYDDNYSSAFPALDVALKTFEGHPTVLIAGGKDRGLDLSETKKRIFSAPNLAKAILIGETKTALADGAGSDQFQLADSLEDAVNAARQIAESIGQPAIVLMSPGAASFDMFKNFEDRGNQYQQIIKNLKETL